MDVAALALNIDSNPVEAAIDRLDRFSASAEKAGAAAKKISGTGSTAKLGQDYERAARAADQASGSISRIADAVTRSNRAMTAANDNAGRSFAQANAHVLAYQKHLAAIPAAANQAAVGLGRVTKAVNDTARNMQATPGNIAAQFQDIGVTAAMGMNPMLIALQQGTQLSSAFAGGGLKSLGAAFREILSPTTLLTIGIVALVAALIQMIDWTGLARSVLTGLADILEAIAPYAVAAAGALALLYAPAIVTGIAAVTKAIWGMAAGLLALIPIPVLIVAGLTAIVAAAVHFRDDMKQYLGFDIVQAAQDGLNWIIGGFVGAYNAIGKVWSKLPAVMGDVAYSAANAVLAAVEWMINRTIDGMNALLNNSNSIIGKIGGTILGSIGNVSLGRAGNPYAGARAEVGGIAAATIAAAQGVDYIGNGIARVRDMAGDVADKFREWAKALGVGDKKDGKGGAGGAAATDRLADILREAQADITAQENRLKAVGMSARAAAELEQQTKLLNQIQKAGIPLTAALRTEVEKLSQAYADAKINADIAEVTRASTREIEKQIEAIEEESRLIGLRGDALARAQRELDAQRKLRDGLPVGEIVATGNLTGGLSDTIDADNRRRRIAEIRQNAEDAAYAMDLERTGLELTGQAALEYSFIVERLNDAKREGRELSAAELSAIYDAADAYAAQRYAIDQQAKSIADTREVARGFFTDLFAGLREGGNAFKVFADAAVNSLNRIIEKLLDRALNGFLNGLFPSGGAKLQAASLATIAANPSIFAKGGVFGTAQRFAKGGAFTNQIVSSPTLFKFANGGALGEMGEAGPEAIMPLKRGPNGALGVQAHGGGSRSVYAPVTVQNDYNIQGAVTPTDIMAMIRAGGQATAEEVKRQLGGWLQEYDRDGTVAV